MTFATKPLRLLSPACSLFVLVLAANAHAASFSGSPVAKSEWAASPVADHIDMYIALPDTLPAKPPILVNIHSCGNNAGGQWSYDGFEPLRAAMDSVGFIMILPQQSQNCWNVGLTESLTHGGGGDTGAIVQMVQYALEKYNGDPTRVYVMGGSGGGMCTQALLAVYPEIFKAGSERAGVPAGCWAEGYQDQPDQWSGTCANGMVDKTAQEWGELVRQMNPSFTGPRPRVQLNHGNADGTINFKNLGESVEQWTNVLGLDATPSSTDSDFAGAAKISSTGAPMLYNRQFWQDDCGFTVLEAWEAINQEHNMGYESEAILKWFGLDMKRDQDPWDAACGNAGGSSDGTSGSGSNDSTGAGATGAPQTADPIDSSDNTTETGPSGSTSTSASVASSSGTASATTAAPTTAPVATSNGATSATPTTSAPTAVAPGSTQATATSVGTTTAHSTSSGSTKADDSGTDGGCSVGVRATGFGAPLTLVGLGLLLRRRHRRA
jgi:acetylxylan esterase